MKKEKGVKGVNSGKQETQDSSVLSDFTRVVSDIKDKQLLQRYYADNPYVVLGLAAVTGYVVAGGLFTPFSRRLIRIGMKSVFVPVAASKLADIGFGKGED